MKLPRRAFLHLAAGAAALPAMSRMAWAQAYPTRPVHLIVPFGPAGAADITARLIGQWLSERLGQPFIIDNRPGAGSNIGTEAVVRAPADGYTLLLCGAFSAINATLYDKLNFNFVRDIAPIALIVRFPYIMLVNPSVPANTLHLWRIEPDRPCAPPYFGAGARIAASAFSRASIFACMAVSCARSAPTLKNTSFSTGASSLAA